MKQHFVPQCYLKAWCDPLTPEGHEPYVWRFSKDGNKVKKASPKKIFRETDMYTITMPDGSKDFRLERGLHDLEDQFVHLRDTKLASEKEATIQEHILLLAFISAMHNRTKVQRDHQKNQWGKVFEMAEAMKKWAENATPEERQAAGRSISQTSKEPALSYDEVKKLATDPMQNLLPLMISTEVPLLYKLNTAIFVTSNSPGFITSDRPVVWFDPKSYLRPPIFRGPALMYESIEITMPISPRHLIFLNRRGIEGYIDVSATRVNELNRRTRFYSDEYFIVNQNKKETIWFDQGKEPDDSWEKTHSTNSKIRTFIPRPSSWSLISHFARRMMNKIFS